MLLSSQYPQLLTPLRQSTEIGLSLFPASRFTTSDYTGLNRTTPDDVEPPDPIGLHLTTSDHHIRSHLATCDPPDHIGPMALRNTAYHTEPHRMALERFRCVLGLLS